MIVRKVVTNGLFTGRTILTTDYDEVSSENIVEILDKVFPIHEINQYQIDYLYNYYKGNQPILRRKKEVREEINNKVVENRANEIVTFKTGYLIGQPIQYVTRRNEKGTNESLDMLNDFIYEQDKVTKDKQLVEWMHICGTGYRMITVNKNEKEESPFRISTLDPRNAFVVYKNDESLTPIMGVKYIVKEDNKLVFSVYTEKEYFELEDNKLIKQEPHTLQYIPIIEYPLNNARLGSFEIVLGLCDAENTVISNRLDGIEQFIQALLVFKGVDIDDESFKSLKEQGALRIPADGDVQYLVQQLNQVETQTLKKDIYESILTICGMPNRNGGSSTSDTGSAVIMRDGWSAAEARAQDTEDMIVASEKKFLKLALNIMNILKRTDLKLADVGIRFTRRNYENIQGKAQVLTTMLGNEKIDPKLAFEHCGMFTDPNLAYEMSMKYAKEELKRQKEQLANAFNNTNKEGE